MSDRPSDGEELDKLMSLISGFVYVRETVDEQRRTRGLGRITIEPQEPNIGPVHGECGDRTVGVYGFVSDDDNALAVYRVRWTFGKRALGAEFLISLYGWGEGADETQRRLVALRCHYTDNGPGFEVLDAPAPRWGGLDRMGTQMSREEVLASDSAREVFEIADIVLVEDPAVRDFFYDYDAFFNGS